MLVAIGKTATTSEISDSFFAVANVLHGDIKSQLREGTLEHEDIVFTILSYQDDRMRF